MKVHVLFAALVLALPLPALAAEGHQHSGSGHYEWRPVPPFGPKATGSAQKRVWVPDDGQMANCVCDMMKMKAADCMKDMQGMHASPSVG